MNENSRCVNGFHICHVEHQSFHFVTSPSRIRRVRALRTIELQSSKSLFQMSRIRYIHITKVQEILNRIRPEQKRERKTDGSDAPKSRSSRTRTIRTPGVSSLPTIRGSCTTSSSLPPVFVLPSLALWLLPAGSSESDSSAWATGFQRSVPGTRPYTSST